METEHELNDKISRLTLLIQEKYPELMKYMSEMTVTLPDENNPEINVENLKAYYNELNTFYNDYKLSHPKSVWEKDKL